MSYFLGELKRVLVGLGILAIFVAISAIIISLGAKFLFAAMVLLGAWLMGAIFYRDFR